MDFKTAYAKFCSFVLEKLETNELNGTKLNGYRKAGDSKDVIAILDVAKPTDWSPNPLVMTRLVTKAARPKSHKSSRELT